MPGPGLHGARVAAASSFLSQSPWWAPFSSEVISSNQRRIVLRAGESERRLKRRSRRAMVNRTNLSAIEKSVWFGEVFFPELRPPASKWLATGQIGETFFRLSKILPCLKNVSSRKRGWRERKRESSPPSCRVTFSDWRRASLNTLQQVVFKFLEFNKPTPSRNGSRSSPAFVSPLFASWILVGPWIHEGEGFKVILTGKLVISELGWSRGRIHYHDSSLWVIIRLLLVWLWEVETYRDIYFRMHITRRCVRNIQTNYLLRYL